MINNTKHTPKNTWAIIAALIVLFVLLLGIPILMKQIPIKMHERSFDAKGWRSEPDLRYLMANDLKDKIKVYDYNRDDIIHLLGGPDASISKDHAVSWYLGACSDIPSAYCDCWFDVRFMNGHVDKINMLCGS